MTFIKILSRKSCLLVDLIVPPGADTEALTSYWARGRRNKDIGALLSSLARRPGGGTIDIVHLLPPFARRYLYTFPVPTGRSDDAARDCHWTSLNFFAEPPGERFLEAFRVIRTLLREYRRVTDPPKLGDIALLVDPREQGVHSCVYVAENIVFTKNGAAFSLPWQLARLDNVIAFYQHRGSARSAALSRPLSGSTGARCSVEDVALAECEATLSLRSIAATQSEKIAAQRYDANRYWPNAATCRGPRSSRA